MNGPPAQDIPIDVALVRGLLAEQQPDLADFSIEKLAEGWDNVSYRLGERWVVRLPRRQASAHLVQHEQRWLPELAHRLPLPVPIPIRAGAPSASLGYAWPWSVCPWLPGAPFEHAPPADLAETARSLGRFIVALHVPAPPEAPLNPYRGTPLASRSERLLTGLDSIGEADLRAAIVARWNALIGTPPWRAAPCWLHGDLHPLNLLVDEGRLSAVIDFGDMCAGDPASDLAIGWMLFPKQERQLFRATAGVDDDSWRRGQAWALALGVAFAGGDERLSAIARRTLSEVLADQP